MRRLLPLLLFAPALLAQTAIFPGGIAGDQNLKVAANNVQCYTTGALTSTATSFTVSAGCNVVNNGIVTVDHEEISICSISGQTLTVGSAGSCPSTNGRGFDGTTAAAHSAYVGVAMFMDAWHHNALKAEVEAVESYLYGGGTGVSFTGPANQIVATPNGSSGSASVRAMVLGDVPTGYSYSNLSGTPTLYYQTFEANGTPSTQRSHFNLAQGSNVTITASDNGTDTTTYTIASTGGSGTPGGSSNSVQYNNSGAFGGVLNTTGTNKFLTQSSSAAPAWSTLTASDMPAFTGDTATSAGSTVTTTGKINGTTVPTNSAADQTIVTTASATGSWASLPACLDSGGNHLNYNTSTHAFTCGTSGGSVGSVSFSAITGSTNTSAAMVVGTGGSLSATGSGTIAATGLGSQAYFTASTTATVGTIVDGDCAQVGPFTLSSASLGDMVFVGVSAALPSGVHAIAKVTSSGNVGVDVCNLSEASQTIGSATYKVALLH